MSNLKRAALAVSVLMSIAAAEAVASDHNRNLVSMALQIGVRPFYLIEDVDEGH
ncbi:MAG: hypothetical protein WBW79_08465 [Desulfocapsaceae bacterium]